MTDRQRGWIGLTEGLIMVGAAGISAAIAYISGAGGETILAIAIIASVAGKFACQRWTK